MDNTKLQTVSIDGRSFIFSAITPRILDDAARVRKITYSNVLREGALTIEEANRIITERKILTEDDHKKNIENRIIIAALEEKLEGGEEKEKIEISMKINSLRDELIEYGMKLNEIMANTAEYISQDQANIYVATKILCNEKNEPIFNTVEELRVGSDSNELYAKAIEDVLYFINGFDKDFESSYLEVGILKAAGYEKDEITNGWGKVDVKENTDIEMEDDKPQSELETRDIDKVKPKRKYRKKEKKENLIQ